ncbi:hypothetical protein [Streptomyces noursei]|uniref:Uncharacterized protein n=2 Tax=Streptomyces noursei TaxID=1971 RepID=A0A401QRV0_STRNR|nr:hypothetical protein [Streptomyces noursei]EOT03104.1 hypothetical protein K530_15331 [Streptomyces noursei CCRC 11814]EXU86595.1 hypothetical protein P354_41550 [Streptomyces noursei PD-1]GCB88032.1 hypothetical protein SALB_00701 [Streptomyces noursei]
MSTPPENPHNRRTHAANARSRGEAADEYSREAEALGEADASRGRAEEFQDRGLTPDAVDAHTTAYVMDTHAAEHSADAKRVEAANSHSVTVAGLPTGKKTAAPREQPARVPPTATRKAQTTRRIP